jgi:hypothetical protein
MTRSGRPVQFAVKVRYQALHPGTPVAGTRSVAAEVTRLSLLTPARNSAPTYVGEHNRVAADVSPRTCP